MSSQPRASGYFRTSYAQDVALLQTRMQRVSAVVFGIISTPTEPLYRMGRRQNPLAPAPWDHVGWGRFDHPRPKEQRFRVFYAGERRACFVETLARAWATIFASNGS